MSSFSIQPRIELQISFSAGVNDDISEHEIVENLLTPQPYDLHILRGYGEARTLLKQAKKTQFISGIESRLISSLDDVSAIVGRVYGDSELLSARAKTKSFLNSILGVTDRICNEPTVEDTSHCRGAITKILNSQIVSTGSCFAVISRATYNHSFEKFKEFGKAYLGHLFYKKEDGSLTFTPYLKFFTITPPKYTIDFGNYQLFDSIDELAKSIYPNRNFIQLPIPMELEYLSTWHENFDRTQAEAALKTCAVGSYLFRPSSLESSSKKGKFAALSISTQKGCDHHVFWHTSCGTELPQIIEYEVNEKQVIRGKKMLFFSDYIAYIFQKIKKVHKVQKDVIPNPVLNEKYIRQKIETKQLKQVTKIVDMQRVFDTESIKTFINYDHDKFI